MSLGVVPNVFKDQTALIFKSKQFLQIPLPNSFDSFLMQHHVHYNTIRNLSALRQPFRITEHIHNRHCLLCNVRNHLHKLCCQIKHLMLLYASLTTSEQMGLQKLNEEMKKLKSIHVDSKLILSRKSSLTVDFTS